MGQQPLRKYGDEEETYQIDFAAEIGEGDSIQSVESVEVLRSTTRALAGRTWAPAGPWDDVSAEFLTGAPTFAGTAVSFTLKERAAATEQAPGAYSVAAKVVMVGGRKTIVVAALVVLEDGAVV